MIPQDMADLMEGRYNAIVAINRPSNSPQLTPIWFYWDGEALYFRIAKSTAKYRNLRRNSSVSLMVTNTTGFRYLTVYGQAHLWDTDSGEISQHIALKYFSPTWIEQNQPHIPEPDPNVVVVKVIPEKVVSTTESIAKGAVESWLSNL
ncbi:pyridoxamine 5'-phosphate oxidase family protein [Ktedonospora formicarum]|uniref:Pyridoxamine 5'-phosphate oxidase N-terminal domain-containing protein n=1 Tax=Ktedonospora formicarum TaxID=2778364 RepID=A0A8J3MYZ9_9CHLR|nr:pyridoxamine 5'-phosphate oxidase family protein [Ktedonospora formicarum]GHO51461.1 hypothetical protein KSX_96240 [Ktedonospora formicarum]